ncbi:MAG: hypothetical protein M1830_008544 [Pleopsidium flavum]|nr:MAG: hypothetical protein M1830_008544 [Pleopsidium flavum]
MAIVEDVLDGVRPTFAVAVLSIVFLYTFIIRPLYFAPLSHVPGPSWCKISWYYLAYFDVRLERNSKIAEWHQKYGPIICIRQGAMSFSDPLLMREIYGTTGKYSKSDFFDHFIAYGARPLFAIVPYWEHQRKRSLISSFYHKSSVNKPARELSVRKQVRKLLQQIELRFQAKSGPETMHVYPMFTCFAFDNISRLLYGPRHCSHTIQNEYEERQLLPKMKLAQLWGPLKYNFPLAVKASFLTRRVLSDEFEDSLTAEDDLAM